MQLNPFYLPVRPGSIPAAPFGNPDGFMNAQMRYNPGSQMITSPRPYSYATDHSRMAGMYTHINQDFLALSTVCQMRSTERIMPLVETLVQRTPAEIEAIRRH